MIEKCCFFFKMKNLLFIYLLNTSSRTRKYIGREKEGKERKAIKIMWMIDFNVYENIV